MILIIMVYIQCLYILLCAFYDYYENYLYNGFYLDCFFLGCYQHEKGILKYLKRGYKQKIILSILRFVRMLFIVKNKVFIWC